jgi:hypothetical protein
MYRYDRKQLVYVRIKWMEEALYAIGIFIILGLITFSSVRHENKELTEDQVMIIVTKYNQFSKEKLIYKIKEMHFQFPHIVYAQALHETEHFSSSIFMENNNLFGMRQAVYRINLAKGINNSHAYYSNWMDSVYDYALYCATYLSKLSTEEDYFSYLEQYYAEDKLCISKLKKLIKEEDLKSIFN